MPSRMASSMALLVLALVAVGNVLSTRPPRASATMSLADLEGIPDDAVSLLQTDVVIAPKSNIGHADICNTSAVSTAAEPGVLVGMLKKTWQWLAQGETGAKDVTEAAKRFHKDFIAAALLMTCVLPWSRQSSGDSVRRQGQHRLWRLLPSGQCLRYLAVFLLWMKHYWFTGHNTFLEFSFVILGIVFDFVDQHSECEDDMWKRLADFVPERFARLYPLYALYVIAYYLIFFSSPCNAIETLLGGNVILSHLCGIGAWLISVVFGCYLVALLLASPLPQQIQSSSVAMVCAGCVAMVLLPRTLAAPVHRTWTWSDERASTLHTTSDGVGYELFFTRRSLLLGLAYYFFGLVLARVRLVVCAWLSESKDVQPTAKPDADLWKAFEDEAQKEMIGSLSVNRLADHLDHGHGYSSPSSLSPRSNHSD